jgi:ATP-dependent DNA helicase RecG
MKPAQKSAVMQAQFKQGQLQPLVATTVIEVVDAPNASLTIIENPERLKVWPQLHQLRGCVCRGVAQPLPAALTMRRYRN